MNWVLQADVRSNLGFWDVVDVAIAGYLVYLLYKLLKDSAAFNIFIGVLLVYVLSWTVRAMNMSILTTILDQFVNVGVIILVIIFQPEIRRFLLVVGSTRLKSRLSEIERYVRSGFKIQDHTPAWIDPLMQSIGFLKDIPVDAVVVIADNINHDSYANSGVTLRADISKEALEAICIEASPLSDGAVIIQNGKIVSAGCSLPTKSIKSHPDHSIKERSAMGISEQTNDFSIVIDAHHGELSYSIAGELYKISDVDDLKSRLVEHLNATFVV